MLYKFHITGYTSITKGGSGWESDCPVDVTVYAMTVGDAIAKAEDVLGEYISLTHRKIVIEEVPEW